MQRQIPAIAMGLAWIASATLALTDVARMKGVGATEARQGMLRPGYKN